MKLGYCDQTLARGDQIPSLLSVKIHHVVQLEVYGLLHGGNNED